MDINNKYSDMEDMMRPPRGLKPKFIHDEHRLKEVSAAIARYTNARLPIPSEWIIEYNELINIVLNDKRCL